MTERRWSYQAESMRRSGSSLPEICPPFCDMSWLNPSSWHGGSTRTDTVDEPWGYEKRYNVDNCVEPLPMRLIAKVKGCRGGLVSIGCKQR